MDLNATEIIGYLASAGVLISFLNKDIIKLRIINSFGCALFVTYGVMLNTSLPIIITNSAILLIHLYYLVLKPKDH